MTAVAVQPPVATPDKAASAVVVEARGLRKSMDGRAILKDVSLTASAGEVLAVLGANGAGKSTLLRIIATLMPPSGGSLNLFGEDALGRFAATLRARIGMVGHQLMLYRELSPRENLEFFARLYDLKDPVGRARQMLEMVGLAGRADDPVKTFSRGMAQRVAIARALLHDPALLLADEPFTGLDATSATALETLLQQLAHEADKSILVVNHDLDQTLRVADRVVVLARGCVALDVAADRVTARNLLKEISE